MSLTDGPLGLFAANREDMVDPRRDDSRSEIIPRVSIRIENMEMGESGRLVGWWVIQQWVINGWKRDTTYVYECVYSKRERGVFYSLEKSFDY